MRQVSRRETFIMITMAILPSNSAVFANEIGSTPLTIDEFREEVTYSEVQGKWRGFSDRVMGGASDATFSPQIIGDKHCIRLQGKVTRDQGGGFIQMARYFGSEDDTIDASSYKGIEIEVYGNNEAYNIHLRTSDVRWYSQSYRTTIVAEDKWQTIRLPWAVFIANEIDKPLNTAKIQRIGILGWMREFQADISLSSIKLYK
jgi:hypothetical protein